MPEHPSAPRLMLRKKQHATVADTIDRWQQSGVIDPPTAARLHDAIAASPFDWQRTARYAFLISIISLVIALSAALADELLVRLLMRLFDTPALVKCLFFVALAAGFFTYGLRQRERRPHRLYSNEALFFLGVLALAAAVGLFGVAIDTGSGHYALLFLLAAVLYALLGLYFPSTLVWVFALLSLGAWMGTETGYVSGYGMYFLGMNYPLRFVLFGAALTALGLAGQQACRDAAAPDFATRLLGMSAQTTVVGLLYLFVALWIMSIFGNYGDMDAWRRAPQYELLHWSVLFGAAALGAIWYGLRHDDGVLRGFGLTFLFINLYTRFFEYFWDATHKALFFALLAASFWYLGRKAEAIWHLGQRGQPATSASR